MYCSPNDYSVKYVDDQEQRGMKYSGTVRLSVHCALLKSAKPLAIKKEFEFCTDGYERCPLIYAMNP
jgi:hypothetical protein